MKDKVIFSIFLFKDKLEVLCGSSQNTFPVYKWIRSESLRIGSGFPIVFLQYTSLAIYNNIENG